MGFLNPFFLVGALAAGLPILVHLVRRTRSVRLPFSSLMFLRRIEQKTIRRRKLRNLLLLALRCAALLFLALAFARPYFTGNSGKAAASSNTRTVILLDTSYSMRYPGVFDRAIESARDLVQRSGSLSEIGLATFSGSYQILRKLKPGREEVVTILGRVQAGLGTTDYLQAVQAGDSMLKEAGPGPGVIYLISDFHQTGWNRDTPSPSLPSGAKLVAIDVGDKAEDNLAVTQVIAEPVVYAQKYSAKVLATIADYESTTPAAGAAPRQATLELRINDLVAERRPIQIAPGASQTVEFSGFNLLEGSNRLSVEIDGDNFPLDNKYFFTIKRESQTKVLALETAVRGRSETFYLRQSLLAGNDSPYELTVKTPGSVNPADIGQYRVVILNDVGNLSDDLTAAIKAFVQNGGSLLLAAGAHTNAGEINKQLGNVLPARIGDTVQPKSIYALMSQVKVDDPIFSVFKQGGHIAPARVYAYHSSQPSDQASVIASLDDGSPLFIEGPSGNGKTIVITTSLDNSWTDLPLTPMFLPMVRQILNYLAGKNDRPTYQVDQIFSAPLGAGGARPEIQSPDGSRAESLPTPQNGLVNVRGSQNGFYRLNYSDHTDFVAVNLDTKESDCSRLNPDELMAGIAKTPSDTRALDETQPPTPDQIEARQRVWIPLLLMALLFFLGEAVMAGRIRVPKFVT